MSNKNKSPNSLDAVIAKAQKDREERENNYRAKALKMYPWICGRCSREFTRETVQELTVHHRNHNHDDNPEDGSNWELLCLYCHDNEHQRLLESERKGSGVKDKKADQVTHNPFGNIRDLLK